MELLLNVEPSNKNALRKQTIGNLWARISGENLDRVNELIRIFDISAADVHAPLKKAILMCIDHGPSEAPDRIFKFLDHAVEIHNALRSTVECTCPGLVEISETVCRLLGNNPREYRLAVDAALGQITQERMDQFGTKSQKHRYKMFQNWVAKEESRQKKEDAKVRDAHLNLRHSIAG